MSAFVAAEIAFVAPVDAMLVELVEIVAFVTVNQDLLYWSNLYLCLLSLYQSDSVMKTLHKPA